MAHWNDVAEILMPWLILQAATVLFWPLSRKADFEGWGIAFLIFPTIMQLFFAACWIVINALGYYAPLYIEWGYLTMLLFYLGLICFGIYALVLVGRVISALTKIAILYH